MFMRIFKENNSIWGKPETVLRKIVLLSHRICPLCNKKNFRDYILTISNLSITKLNNYVDKHIDNKYFNPKYIIYHQECLQYFNKDYAYSENIYCFPFTKTIVYGFKGLFWFKITDSIKKLYLAKYYLK